MTRLRVSKHVAHDMMDIPSRLPVVVSFDWEIISEILITITRPRAKTPHISVMSLAVDRFLNGNQVRWVRNPEHSRRWDPCDQCCA